MSTSFAQRPILVPPQADGGEASEPVLEPGPTSEAAAEPRRLRAVGPGREASTQTVGDVAVVAQSAVERLGVARNPEVAADDAWSEAGRKVLRFHLSRMLARVPGTIAGEDPEEIHAMRVASRRLRAGWRVFGDGFEAPIVRRHVRQVRLLGTELGAVRDLDVQVGILVAYRERRSKRERTALMPVLETWQAERAARQRNLVDLLQSPWFRGFVADHEAFVMTPEAGARQVGIHDPATVRTRAPSIAWGSYQATWAFDSTLPGADVATLHELRIATKWLRYTLESIREPMEPNATELIRRVVALQDHLGDIHDLHATAERARATAGASADMRSGERAAIERFVVAKDLRVERLRGRLGPTWRSVSDAEYRRRLGQSLALL